MYVIFSAKEFRKLIRTHRRTSIVLGFALAYLYFSESNRRDRLCKIRKLNKELEELKREGE